MMMMIITIIIIIIIIVVVAQKKSTNDFLVQLGVFNTSPCKENLSLCFTNQNGMKAHAQKLNALTLALNEGQRSAARSGRHTPGQKAGWAPERGARFGAYLAPCRESYHHSPCPTTKSCISNSFRLDLDKTRTHDAEV